MAEATKDFEELLGCLKRHEAKFAVVGPHAVAYHAKPLYTKDFDLLVEPNAANGERVVAALEEFGFGGLGIAAADFASVGRILQMGVPPNRVDLMTSIDGVDFDEVWSGRVEGAYGNQIVPPQCDRIVLAIVFARGPTISSDLLSAFSDVYSIVAVPDEPNGRAVARS